MRMAYLYGWYYSKSMKKAVKYVKHVTTGINKGKVEVLYADKFTGKLKVAYVNESDLLNPNE
jgi:hypothetical protein